jgi:DNA topoisomerase-2
VFEYKDQLDDEHIELAFAKKFADKRKDWLETYDPVTTFVDHSILELRYMDFINKELILFSIADCARSIPSLCDGLKPGQRKILFCCFKRKLFSEVKVAQLCGYIAEHSAYHHGEVSLQTTIVSLA